MNGKQLMLGFATLALLDALALGHAFVDHAEPRVGSTESASPPSVRIWFTQQPEVDFSGIEVFDTDGKRVDNRDCRADDKDRTELLVSLPKLGPGTYRVKWHVMSVDTHKTHGDFKFTISP